MKKKAVILGCMLVFPQLAAAPLIGAETVSMKASPGIIASDAIQMNTSQKQIMNAKISKDKAIEIAKNFILVPKDFSQQSINYQSNWYPGNRTVWNVNWNKQSEQGYANISVTVDANTGTVISMNRWDDTYNQPAVYPPKYNWDSAKKIAEQFLQEKVPEKASFVKVDTSNLANQKPPLQGNAHYYYTFLRVENDMPFQDQYISVNVNANGEVTSYEYRWTDDVTIPVPTGMLAQSEAEKKIKESLQVQLKYQTIYNYQMPLNKQKSIKLAYDNRFSYPYIDARTGEWLDFSGKPVDMKDFTKKLEPLSSEKKQAPTPVTKDITQEQAVELAKKQFTIPDDAILENVYFSDVDQYQKYPVWNLSWALSQKEHAWIHVSINGKTGQIISYSKDDPSRYSPYGENEKIKQVISYEQALEKAKAVLKLYAANDLDELTFDPLRNPKPAKPDTMRDFYFTFHRLYDGIIVEDQFATVSISTETGEVFQFHQNWDDQAQFPDATQAVPLNQGKEAYLDNFTIVPKYLYLENIDYTTPRPTVSKPEVKLVYHFAMKPQEQGVYLDASQGKWLSMETGEPIRAKIEAKDIKGHPNEKALQLLIDHYAIEVDDAGFVKPDQEISRGEMVKMLMLVTNPDPYYYKMNYGSGDRAATFNDVASTSPYFAYIESAVQQGLLEKTGAEFKPNEPVTREEMAEMIVKVMHLDQLAQVPSLFNLNFADREQINKKGHAAIVHHLGIMKAENNSFKPAEKVTRAGGAQVFYQFLQERGKYNK